jgi:predicted Fe-Mo cluster-binding NifX family protein
MEQKIAISITGGELSSHFGHTEQYVIFTVKDKEIVDEVYAIPPEHEYGSHPRFLKELNCNVVITGGMGMKAQQLLSSYGIKTVIGVPNLPVKELISNYLQNTLETGINRCDH